MLKSFCITASAMILAAVPATVSAQSTVENTVATNSGLQLAFDGIVFHLPAKDSPIAGPVLPAVAFAEDSEFRLIDPEESAPGTDDPPTVDAPITVTGMEEIQWAEIKRYEMVYQGLAAIDLAETIIGLSGNRLQEANPVLGENPSTITVIGYKAAWSVAHYYVAKYLTGHNIHAARIFEGLSIGLQGSAVTWNLVKLL